jgi:hypothetical protein
VEVAIDGRRREGEPGGGRESESREKPETGPEIVLEPSNAEAPFAEEEQSGDGITP